jgi:hypothetical protein
MPPRLPEEFSSTVFGCSPLPLRRRDYDGHPFLVAKQLRVDGPCCAHVQCDGLEVRLVACRAQLPQGVESQAEAEFLMLELRGSPARRRRIAEPSGSFRPMRPTRRPWRDCVVSTQSSCRRRWNSTLRKKRHGVVGWPLERPCLLGVLLFVELGLLE